MKIDFKVGFILLVLIVLGVYLGNMWTHKMVSQEEKQKAYEAYLASLAQDTTATA